MKKITNELIRNFKVHLINEEKSSATIEKYIRDITIFNKWLDNRNVEKILVMEYKQELIQKYAPASVNSILSSINNFFKYMEWFDCMVKTFKIQRQIFSNKEKELTKEEYHRLLTEAKKRKNEKLYMLMQTICSTGIRVSELQHITTDAVRKGEAVINCKGKMRVVILPKQLCQILKIYIKKNKISSGPVFVTKKGTPLDRSNIWKLMKNLCINAKVSKHKVFPHNLRHLFARTYYSIEKDIVKLADILGHSNINTTRIYTKETVEHHRIQIQKLGLLKC